MTIYYAAILIAFAFALASQTVARAGARELPVMTPRAGRNTAGQLAFAAGMCLVLVSALRWHVGTDYWTYESLYPAYRDIPIHDYTLTNEPGMPFLAKLASFVCDDPAMMLAISAVFTLGVSVNTVYRQSPNFALSIVLFALTGPWLGSFNGVRQYLACAVIFAGHPLIFERKLARWLLVVTLASLFHISAIVMLPLYLIPRQMSLWISTGVLVAAGLMTEAYGRILELAAVVRPDVELSGPNSYATRQLNLLRVVAAVTPILFYALFTRKDRLHASDNFYIYVLLINGATLIAASGSAYVARFAIYPGFFTCLAIPRLLSSSLSKQDGFFMAAIVAMYLIFWYVETTGIPELATYNWIWDRS